MGDHVMNTKKINDKKIILETIIKENGYKLTTSRSLMLDFFLNHHKHYKAEDIYDGLRKEKLGMATIYRNLELFRTLGIIRGITFDHLQYYELNILSHKRLHVHFYCNSCHSITESNDTSLLQKIMEQKDFLEEHYGNQVEEISVVMKGQCKSCLDKS